MGDHNQMERTSCKARHAGASAIGRVLAECPGPTQLQHDRSGHAFVTDGYLDATDFAARLDRAIDRSDRARLIEGKAVEDH